MFVHMLIPEYTGTPSAAWRTDTAHVPMLRSRVPRSGIPRAGMPDLVRHADVPFPHTVLISFFLVLLLFPVSLSGADAAPRRQAAGSALSTRPGAGEEQESERDARELLLNAKDALSSGNIRYLRARLGGKVYLNLFTGINGYYSAEQAYLILESFFATYTPISFSFSSRNFSIRNPYGFGPLTYERRGRRGSAEMFISLAQVGDRWVINQITVATR